jgi:hypothetical protein
MSFTSGLADKYLFFLTKQPFGLPSSRIPTFDGDVGDALCVVTG